MNLFAAIYCIISGALASLVTIYTHIGSIFYDADRLTYVLVFFGTLLFWPIILVVALVQWIIMKVRGES